MCANHSTIGAIFADLTGLEPAILGLTNLRCIPLKLQINFESHNRDRTCLLNLVKYSHLVDLSEAYSI